MTDASGQRHLLEVLAPTGWDFAALATDLANDRPVSFAGCRVLQISDVFAHLRTDIEDAILTHGLSNLLRRLLVTEAVVPPGATQTDVGDILTRFLSAIGVDSELIVVDPYFFHRCDAAYAGLLKLLLAPLVPVLTDLHIVTLPNKCHGKVAVEAAIATLNPAPRLHHHTSCEYHDRVWISHARSRGLLTGSSLNSLGHKYALVDRLGSDDVQFLVSSLRDAGFLS